MGSSTPSILLRFRDFDADSIREHEALRAEVGYVWWGWWKKKDEPERGSALRETKVALEAGPLDIGLFDRSTDRFYSARVVDCAFVDGKTPLPSPEPENTPAYYRAKQVPAWFRIVEFHELTPSTFTKRFSLPPIGIRTFFVTTKEEIEELREEVAPRSEIPQLKGSTILHISDLHFGDHHGFPISNEIGRRPVLDIILNDIASLCSDEDQVGFVVVSGDITSGADANMLFYPALPIFQELVRRLSISKEHVVFVPGNHDLPLNDYSHIDYHHEFAFRAFLEKFYGKPTETLGFRKFYLPDNRMLEVLLVNSVHLRKPELKRFGYVGWPLYEAILAEQETVENTLRLAVMHHHLIPAVREELLDPKFPEAGVSVTLDAGAVLEGLQKHGFPIVMHGHQHTPCVSRVSRGRYQDGSLDIAGLDAPLYVLAGGSAGVRADRLSPEMPENTYSLLRIHNGSAQLRVRRFTSAGVVRDHIVTELDLPG